MNWLMIFLMCLMCLFIIMMMINSLLLFYMMKIINFNKNNKCKNYMNNKWKWMW
nr:TPA_asm: ATP8 [Bombus sylvicola]